MTDSDSMLALFEPAVLTVPQFCQRYQVSRSTFYKLARVGEIRIAKVGRKTLIAVEEAERWFRGRIQSSDGFRETRDAA